MVVRIGRGKMVFHGDEDVEAARAIFLSVLERVAPRVAADLFDLLPAVEDALRVPIVTQPEATQPVMAQVTAWARRWRLNPVQPPYPDDWPLPGADRPIVNDWPAAAGWRSLREAATTGGRHLLPGVRNLADIPDPVLCPRPATDVDHAAAAAREAMDLWQPWNPRDETGAAFDDRMMRYKLAVQRAHEAMGASEATQKRHLRHFEWLVRRQVLGEAWNRIAATDLRYADETRAVRLACRDLANLIALDLIPGKPGRPPAKP